MTAQAPTAGAYFTISRTVAAGATDPLDISGNYVACLSSSLGSFKLSLDDGQSSFFAQGIKIRTAAGKPFSKVTVDNSGNGQALSYTLAIGIGDMADARFLSASMAIAQGGNTAQVSAQGGLRTEIEQGGNTAAVSANNGLRVEVEQGGNIAVVTAAGRLVVDPSAAGVPIVAAGGFVAGSNRGGNFGITLEVEPSVKEGGSNIDFTAGGAGVTTIITPATNANGILIRNLQIDSTSSLSARAYADTAAPSGMGDSSKRSILSYNGVGNVMPQQMPYQLFLPSGTGLYFAVGGANARLSGTYDAL